MSNQIRDNPFQKFSSQRKTIKIYLPGNDEKGEGKCNPAELFLDRDNIRSKLKGWLIDTKDPGSYLITGFRGMGKTSVVKKVIEDITRDPDPREEMKCDFAVCLLICSLILLVNNISFIYALFPLFISFALIVGVWFKKINLEKKVDSIIKKMPYYFLFKKSVVKKFWCKDNDKNKKVYYRIPIYINLGYEVLNERDVLCLIAKGVYEKYRDFLNSRHNNPLRRFLCDLFYCGVSYILIKWSILEIVNVFFLQSRKKQAIRRDLPILFYSLLHQYTVVYVRIALIDS